MQERVRDKQTTCQTLVYTKAWWEINKQMFLMKQEALSTQRGFGLFRQTRLWPAGRAIQFDHRHRWRWLWEREGWSMSEVLCFGHGGAVHTNWAKFPQTLLTPRSSYPHWSLRLNWEIEPTRWKGSQTDLESHPSDTKTMRRPDCLNDFWSKNLI